MKKAILIWMFLLSAVLNAIEVNPSAGPYTVGQNLSFRPSMNLGSWQQYTAQWNFGDGSAWSQFPGNQWVSHLYRNPGSFWITLPAIFGAAFVPPETLSITIEENRAITASSLNPIIGQPVTFNAINFKTPANIRWDFGDGTIQISTGTITHSFSREATFTVKAYDWNGDMSTIPVILSLTVSGKYISYTPLNPREDQPITFNAINFQGGSIEWNFGDGTVISAGGSSVSHRYATQGNFVVSAKEIGGAGTAMRAANSMAAVTAIIRITVLPENRAVIASSSEAKVKEPITFRAVNFRGPSVFWDFGDGTTLFNQGTTVTHKFRNAGAYIVKAGDENGNSLRRFQIRIEITGISDLVNLLLAEITLDNGKYYKVVPKNSRNIKAILKMKMKGTGAVSGYWIVDDQPYEFFNETAYQGEIKTIYTKDIPGLPVLQSGMHTITVKLISPAESVVFPNLRYFVLPFENTITPLSPRDASVIKEKEIAEFSWNKANGASRYQIVLSNNLIQILSTGNGLRWIDVDGQLAYLPDPETWGSLKRNQWIYWKVRALDGLGTVIGESPIQEMKIIVPEAKIEITAITDMDGKKIRLENQTVRSKSDVILFRGNVEYEGNAEYLILRVFQDNELTDQLLFRDVIQNKNKSFETSIQNQEKTNQIVFQVVKSSAPSLVIGFQEITLEKGE